MLQYWFVQVVLEGWMDAGSRFPVIKHRIAVHGRYGRFCWCSDLMAGLPFLRHCIACVGLSRFSQFGARCFNTVYSTLMYIEDYMHWCISRQKSPRRPPSRPKWFDPRWSNSFGLGLHLGIERTRNMVRPDEHITWKWKKVLQRKTTFLYRFFSNRSCTSLPLPWNVTPICNSRSINQKIARDFWVPFLCFNNIETKHGGGRVFVLTPCLETLG